jgi:hypothetical protein
MGFSWVIVIALLAVIMPLLFLLFFYELPASSPVVMSAVFTVAATCGWLLELDPRMICNYHLQIR